MDLNWLSGSRMHVSERIIGQLILSGILVLLGVAQGAAAMYFIFGSIHGAFFHSNIKMKFGPLNYILNTPEMHRVHHLSDIRYQNSNFGNRLSLWDWIFGTAYIPSAEEIKDIPYGVGYDYPQHLPGQLFYIFRKEKVKE
jgi:sterol desaturase/sphingolipid hydroxylase (fatty acid hydroxylase superfamily)